MTEIRLSPVGRLWVSLEGPGPRAWRTPGAVRGRSDEQVAAFTPAALLTQADAAELAAALHAACEVPVDFVVGIECTAAGNHLGTAELAIRRLIHDRLQRGGA